MGQRANGVRILGYGLTNGGHFHRQVEHGLVLVSMYFRTNALTMLSPSGVFFSLVIVMGFWEFRDIGLFS